MPIGFASQLSRQHDDTIERAPLNSVINKLSEIIWKEGGFRFWHRTIGQSECLQAKDEWASSMPSSPRQSQIRVQIRTTEICMYDISISSSDEL